MKLCSYVKVQVLEYSSEGIETMALLIQMMKRKILAQVLDIRGFKGRTIAMYLRMKDVFISKRFLCEIFLIFFVKPSGKLNCPFMQNDFLRNLVNVLHFLMTTKLE